MSETAATSETKETQTEEIPADEIIIEICTPRSGNFSFMPTQDILRGEWDRHKLYPGARSNDGVLLTIDRIPGMRIALSISAQHGRIFDPLSLPQFENLLREIGPKLQRSVFHSLKGEIGPSKKSKSLRLSATAVKSWLYWMRRAVDGKNATLLEGTFPTQEEADALPGKTLVNAYETADQSVRYREDEDPNRLAIEPMTREG